MKPGTQGALWMAAGAVILSLLLMLVWHFRADPTKALAFKAGRVDLVARMQVALVAGSEAEKNAVLAVTDEDSQRFAVHARAATAEVVGELAELSDLLATGGTQRERELLAQFSEAFGTLRRIDDEVLTLAVKSTNLKAYGLAYGPAAETLGDMDAALSRVVAKHAAAPDAKQVMVLAFGARIGVLRIQTLLPPHIAEESDAKMDQMEALMTHEGMQVSNDLESLAALPELGGDADVATAVSRFARYGELEARIIALSRENTNVRSLSLSLNQQRKAMLLCREPLDALQLAILDEPLADVTYGRLHHSR